MSQLVQLPANSLLVFPLLQPQFLVSEHISETRDTSPTYLRRFSFRISIYAVAVVRIWTQKVDQARESLNDYGWQ
jgi:hypothetical protein